MKKEFENPMIDIIKFDTNAVWTNDIISGSNIDNTPGLGEGAGSGDGYFEED